MPIISTDSDYTLNQTQTMGSNILDKTSSDIEETNENVSKEKLVNMKFIMKTYVSGALREKEQGNNSKYNELVEILSRDPSNPDAPSTLKLYLWIALLSQKVSSLDKSCTSLVEAAIQIDWSFQNPSFASMFVEFLGNVVSAHGFYILPVLNSLVHGFRYRNRLPENTSVTRTESYDRYHQALQYVLKIVPTGINSLFVSLVRYMPHKRFNSAEQAAYIKNLLLVSEYMPTLRKQILGLVVDQMVQIDAQIQIELDEVDQDIEFEIYNMNFDQDYDSEHSDEDESEEDGMGEGDDDGSIDSTYSQASNDSIQQIKYMVRKLDAMMHLTFEYLSKQTEEIQNQIFPALIDIFDRAILKTLKSRYTQFLVFYMCSLNPIYSNMFLDHLFKHIVDGTRPSITRVAAASYVQSYVARAKFIDPSTIQHAVLSLSSWCIEYISQHESKVVSLNPSKHDVLYAVIQAIMYIFCFRWRDLVLDELDELELDEEEAPNQTLMNTNSGRTWCIGLRDLPRLIMSKFNPLKLCAPAVVQQFAKLSNYTHLMYVYPILEKNREIFVPGLGGENLLQTVQTFFPFDPYKLESSRTYIDNIYFEWIADDDDEDESEEENDETDENDEVSLGMMAMSISPRNSIFLQ